jgi:cytochrome c-type biogenesis protein CcmH
LILLLILALLTVIALLAIIAPLLCGSHPDAYCRGFDQRVYRDQLRELELDISRGLITATEAWSSKLEIQRRLLAADGLPNSALQLSRSPVLAAFLFFLIAAGSLFSYLWLGAPDLLNEPSSLHMAEIPQSDAQSINRLDVQQELVALAAKLKQDPSDAPMWLLYARNLAALGLWDQAKDAYRRAIDLDQTDPEVVIAYAEMIVMQAGGTVTPTAEAAFKLALKADSGTSGIARYYLALASMQAGEPRKAINDFQELLAELPPDSPFRAEIRQQIADAARSTGIPVIEQAERPLSKREVQIDPKAAPVPPR